MTVGVIWKLYFNWLWKEFILRVPWGKRSSKILKLLLYKKRKWQIKIFRIKVTKDWLNKNFILFWKFSLEIWLAVYRGLNFLTLDLVTMCGVWTKAVKLIVMGMMSEINGLEQEWEKDIDCQLYFYWKVWWGNY